MFAFFLLGSILSVSDINLTEDELEISKLRSGRSFRHEESNISGQKRKSTDKNSSPPKRKTRSNGKVSFVTNKLANKFYYHNQFFSKYFKSFCLVVLICITLFIVLEIHIKQKWIKVKITYFNFYFKTFRNLQLILLLLIAMEQLN